MIIICLKSSVSANNQIECPVISRISIYVFYKLINKCFGDFVGQKFWRGAKFWGWFTFIELNYYDPG